MFTKVRRRVEKSILLWPIIYMHCLIISPFTYPRVREKMTNLLPTLTNIIMVSTSIAPPSVQLIVTSLETLVVSLDVYSDPLTPTLTAEKLPQTPPTPDLYRLWDRAIRLEVSKHLNASPCQTVELDPRISVTIHSWFRVLPSCIHRLTFETACTQLFWLTV